MTDVGRDYYENGAIWCIRPLVDGVPHGIHREWYPNGVLKEETPFNHGIIDGTVRYWNEKGELLGESEIKKGTGILRYWIPEQEMYSECSYVDGKWTGRWISYLGGKLSTIRYWLENKRVSRKRYERACQENPRLPRFGNDRELGPTWLQKIKMAGLNKRRTASKSRKPNDDRSIRILESSDAREALSWLQEPGRPPRWLGEATEQNESINFVKRLYRLGALGVHAAKMDGDPEGEQSEGILVVELPKSKTNRAKLLKLCGTASAKLGFDPTADAGQRYHLMMLD